jgi:hypothetical protein
VAANPDYDGARRPAVELEADSLDELAARGAPKSPTVDVDETEGFELAAPDPADEELVAAVVPMLADEFRCPRCFLVHHRSQRASTVNGEGICWDCA